MPDGIATLRYTLRMTTLDTLVPAITANRTRAHGPDGALPFTADQLTFASSGDLFGWTQNVGMGWDPAELTRPQLLILCTQGGIRAQDGTPVALGYHTGHWEVGLQMQAAAEAARHLGAMPFAGYVTDPCDGRTQGTVGMFDSLPYRNDAALVFRRLIRSLPTRGAVVGVATCDKGLPAMMMALAGSRDLPCVLVPGGVTLPTDDGEDLGKVQSIGARFAQGEITLDYAAEMGCKACGSPGGGCQFLGTAATAQVVAEALGIALPHSALAPSGQEIWLEIARASAAAALNLRTRKLRISDVLTDGAIRNAMVVHAAFGGSTNLLLHIPAIAHAAGLRQPNVDDWIDVNRRVSRIVDALPNGPVGHPTLQVFLAGGVPEVMLHLRGAGALDLDALTVSGQRLGDVLDWWARSERRAALRETLRAQDGVDPDDVILPSERAAARGLTRTLTFPTGNLAPLGSVIKSTSIDPSVVGADNVYRKTHRAKVFTREADAIRAVKNGGVEAGDVIVLACSGPMGTGMEETAQITFALKHVSWGKQVALITDGRFSGVSTGACIGHISPEALAGGPLGKLHDGDLIEIVVDRDDQTGAINLVGWDGELRDAVAGVDELARRASRDDLSPHPQLPDDTRLWAALQNASGGVWGGCVYDAAMIAQRLH
jgi:putative YjhG/YagF family dehydratase